jgi:hypothetical protein
VQLMLLRLLRKIKIVITLAKKDYLSYFLFIVPQKQEKLKLEAFSFFEAKTVKKSRQDKAYKSYGQPVTMGRY